MPRRANLRSFSKINLDLRVLRKRADGFHELRTVFQTISLADGIAIEYEAARRTSLTIDDGLNIPNNLIVRAARAVLDATKTTARVHFTLVKKIPMGGGLGGGSSNAAAVLLALPMLTGKRIELAELSGLAAQLGSDVPFFLTGGTAVAVDRGTETYPLQDVSQEPILVVSSGLHVATGPAYAALKRGSGDGLTSTALSRRINSFQAFVESLFTLGSAKLASAFSANDFEPVVFGQYPQLKILSGKLWKAAGNSRMTGSGSALFALFASSEERALAEQMLKRERVFDGCRVMRANLLSRRSYQRLWRAQLAEHLDPTVKIWPPLSRYAR